MRRCWRPGGVTLALGALAVILAALPAAATTTTSAESRMRGHADSDAALERRRLSAVRSFWVGIVVGPVVGVTPEIAPAGPAARWLQVDALRCPSESSTARAWVRSASGVWKRSSGAFAIARWISSATAGATCGLTDRGSGTVWVSTLAAMAKGPLPSKGLRPVTRVNRVAPKE